MHSYIVGGRGWLYMTYRSRDYERFFGPLVRKLSGRGFKMASKRGRYYGDHARGFFVDEIRFGQKIRYGVAFGRNEVRVELIIDRKDAKRILDELLALKSSIEAELALGALFWDRKPRRQRTRVAVVRHGKTIENLGGELDGIRRWAIRGVVRFKKVFDPRLAVIV